MSGSAWLDRSNSRVTARSVRSEESDSSGAVEADFLRGPKWDCFCPNTFKRQNALYRHVLKKHPEFSSKNPSFGKRNMFVRIDSATGFPVKKLCLSAEEAQRRNEAERVRFKEEEKRRLIQKQLVPAFELEMGNVRRSLEKRVQEWSAKIIELVRKVDEQKLEVVNYMNTLKSLAGERPKYGEKWDQKVLQMSSSCGSALPYFDTVLTSMMMLNEKMEQLEQPA